MKSTLSLCTFLIVSQCLSATDLVFKHGFESAEVYPSTATSWVIPGHHDASYDSMGYPISTIDELIDWELSHADIAFGSNYDENVSDYIINIGYMYVQKLDFSPTTVEFDLRDYADNMGENYEDYFLHFAEDTVIQGKYPNHSQYTPFNRYPWLAGWTANETHSGFVVWEHPPYSIKPFKDSANGGEVYFYMPEKFDQIEFDLITVASTGTLVLKYPTSVDATTGVANQWNTINTNIVDGTNGLKVSGTVKWKPPSDWVRAATYDPDTGVGQFFGDLKYLKKGRKSYIIKMDRIGEDINDQPVIRNMMTKRFYPYINQAEIKYLIRGWDEANDLDGDGYVDDSEFASLANPQATARFRYESRVAPLGNMWNETSNFQRPNLANPLYQKGIAKVIKKQWIDNGQIGAYNDDAFKLANINTITGGILAEGGSHVDDPVFKDEYKDSFLDVIREVKIETKSPWVAANTSAENLFYIRENRARYADAFDTFLREDYLRPGMGLDGYFGFAKMWDNFAISFTNKKSVIMAHAGWAGSIPFVNNKDQWQARISTGLAMYYLINVPGQTSFNSWNSSFNYGSNNTVLGNFYKAGVPKNIAYQPSFMLAVNIGEPAQSIQPWPGQTVQPLLYSARTPTDDYAIIGDSTQSVLTHPEIGTINQTGSIEVVASNIYYAWRSEQTIFLSGIERPSQMILARDYSNGLVLYHTTFFGGEADFMSVTNQLTLPGYYHRVNYDGTLQAATNTINLTGYEGAILVK